MTHPETNARTITRLHHPPPASRLHGIAHSEPSPDLRNGLAEDLTADLHAALATPFPVLAGTHLCLELLKDRSSLDLQSLTDLLRRDPVAVLRIFALVCKESPEPANRPSRLEDCIASVSRSDLDLALLRPQPSREEQAAMTSFARHASLIARYAHEVAASLGLGTEPAYLIGLLHAIGELPMRTGRAPAITANAALARRASAIALQYGVPSELHHAIVEVHGRQPGSIWLAVIDAAHDLAAQPATIDQPPALPRPLNLRDR